MMRSPRRDSGFTMLELMIALAILAIVTSQVLGMLSGQLQTQVEQKRVLEAQEDSQMVADMLRRDVRMAGYMVPVDGGLATFDGGTAGSDIVCASDLSLLDDDLVAEATERYEGADITAAVSAAATSVALPAANRDLDGDGDGDFAVGQGIILSSGTISHCARITDIGLASISFTPATPGGFNLPATGIAVPAVVYELNGSELLRNNITLSAQVEDLQVEFAIDLNDDGSIDELAGEFPIHGLNGQDPALLRTVRLSILTRTTREDPEVSGGGRQALGNRTAGTVDNFRRRLVAVTAAPRNMLWGSI